jgi:hypothetical protein
MSRSPARACGFTALGRLNVDTTFLLGYISIFGAAPRPDADERAPARLFQLVMAIQFLIVVLHAVTWLPREPRAALLVLALQVAAALVPIATVIVLES